MSEENELIVVEESGIPALFKAKGCDPLIKRLHETLKAFEPDVTTAKGRKDIASFANKFSKAKVYIDGHGKALVEEEKARLKIVDAERKKFRDECDEMKREARKPLTDWEDAEKKRVADIEERIHIIEDFIDVQLVLIVTAEDAKDALDKVNAITIDDSFEEFELAAVKVKDKVVTQIEAKFIVLQNQEKEKAEAERLEKERLEKEQKEREEQIAKEAAEKATKEAEEKAQKEAEEKEQKEKEEKERLERERLEAQLAKEKAEREKKEVEEKAEREQKEAERDKKEAVEKAEKEKQEAIENEKKRQAEAERLEEEAGKKRQANKQHRGKINREAKESFISAGLTEERAEEVITMIAKGLIANVTINYRGNNNGN